MKINQGMKSKYPAARHIDDGKGKLLCGGHGREPFFRASGEGEPTCGICLDLASMLKQGEGN